MYNIHARTARSVRQLVNTVQSLSSLIISIHSYVLCFRSSFLQLKVWTRFSVFFFLFFLISFFVLSFNIYCSVCLFAELNARKHKHMGKSRAHLIALCFHVAHNNIIHKYIMYNSGVFSDGGGRRFYFFTRTI